MRKEMLSGHNAMSQCGKIAAATTFRLQQLLAPSIAADGFCISSPPLLQTIWSRAAAEVEKERQTPQGGNPISSVGRSNE